MSTQISASILGADLANLHSEINRAYDSGADSIHFDVMDGVFVNNISFGIPVLASVKKVARLPLDVHLMIQEPEKYIKEFAEAGADFITFHVESKSSVEKTIDAIHAYGKKAGLSIKPDTPLKRILSYLPVLERVLIMTVEPGFGGQGFIRHTLDKVAALKNYAGEHGLNLDIQVDGGINEKTALLAREAGANNLVSGTYLFGASNMKAAVEALKA